VSGLLKSYLRELPEPLLPEKDFLAYLEASQLTGDGDGPKRERFVQLLQGVPPANLRVLGWCLLLLSCVVRNAHINKMTASNLAVVLGPNILRRATSDSQSELNDAGEVNRVAEWLILHRQVVPKSDDVTWPSFSTKFVAAAKSIFSLVLVDQK
jgi:hypothetical protein